MYIACQDGLFEVVEFFLDQGLDPKLKSRKSGAEYESCLEVAIRWKYYNIVKLLLEKSNFSKEEIMEYTNIDYISDKLLELLNVKNLKKLIMKIKIKEMNIKPIKRKPAIHAVQFIDKFNNP